jgi:hypothetical protein
VRSRIERQSRVRRVVIAALLALFWLAPATATAQASLPLKDGELPGFPQADAAAGKVREDPNLSREKSVRTLKWKSRAKREEPAEDAASFAWLRGLFGFLGSAGRAVVWVVAGVLAAMLVVFILRMVRERAPAARGRGFVAPTHVRGLDIRPEALPADIGATARALWDAGEHRAALSMLYRGLLSKLAHVHHVPVRESSTEGECLALARRSLQDARARYAEQLIGTWQRAVYGGMQPQDSTVHELCGSFDVELAGGPAAPA